MNDVLYQHKKSLQTVGLAMIRQVIGRLVDGLALCHSNGVMHRNLKPDNILVDLDGNTVLTDFTMARSMTRS